MFALGFRVARVGRARREERENRRGEGRGRG